MIDWVNLFFNSIWILGAALALAVFSMAYYQIQSRGEKLKKTLNTSRFAITLSIAGGLFCLGMTLTSNKWWEIGLWIILVGLFCFQGYIDMRLNEIG